MNRQNQIEIDTVLVPTGDNLSHRRIIEIEEKLDLRQRAIHAGLKNEPDSTDTELDEAQQLIVKEGDHYTGAMALRAQREITEGENQIRRIMPVPLNTLLEEANIQRQVTDAVARQKDTLASARRAQDAAFRGLRAFEESNRLAPQSATYSADWTMFLSVLVALLLIESAMNAVFLQELGEGGWLGGFGLAIGVSALNLALAFMCGFFGWRLIRHVKPSRRAIGWGVTLVAIFAAFVMLLALGDLREGISRDFNAQVDFLAAFDYRKWLHYTTFPPFLLFAGGLVIFFLTAFKSAGGRHGAVSAYWDHDTYDRQHKMACEATTDAEDDLRDSVHEAHGTELTKLLERHAADQQNFFEIRHIATNAHQITQVLADSIRDELDRVAIWLTTYRSLNRAVRTTPAPAYFAEVPDLQEWHARRLDFSGINLLLSEANEIIADNSRKIAALQERLIGQQAQLLASVVADIEAGRHISAQSTAGALAPLNLDVARATTQEPRHA